MLKKILLKLIKNDPEIKKLIELTEFIEERRKVFVKNAPSKFDDVVYHELVNKKSYDEISKKYCLSQKEIDEIRDRVENYVDEEAKVMINKFPEYSLKTILEILRHYTEMEKHFAEMLKLLNKKDSNE